MTKGLARYHARSPRYTLNTEDESLIRYAGASLVPWEEGTQIRNVSLTGLAFTAPEDLAPILGEVIRIQFLVPGAEQMACHGIVTRIEPDSQGRLLVGLHFYKLEMPQRILLAQGLSRKIQQTQDDHDISKILAVSHWPLLLPSAVLMGIFLSLWTWLVVSLLHLGAEQSAQKLWSLLKILMTESL